MESLVRESARPKAVDIDPVAVVGRGGIIRTLDGYDLFHESEVCHSHLKQTEGAVGFIKGASPARGLHAKYSASTADVPVRNK